MNQTCNNNEPIIIGIDHGYGNIKTANFCFRAGVTAFEQEPTFKSNLLVYDGRYYLIGEEHKEFAADKMQDMDYYILTLAAIANELNLRDVFSASVHLAVGLPLTWVSRQKDAFKQYLLQNESVDFCFRGAEYHISFADVDIFPQGFAAIADTLHAFGGVNMLVDIGNGTMSIMYINDCRPQEAKCFTEKYGAHQCVLAVRENLMTQYGTVVEDTLIERVIRNGTAEVSDKYLHAIRATAILYVQGIFRKLREREYNPELMRLFVVGGGSCLIKHFGQYDAGRVTILDDICATAKGYQFLAGQKSRRKGGLE